MASSPRQSKLALVEYLCLFLGLSGCLLLKLDREQPDAYMDEIFHVPQAQTYCNGTFDKWDPMLTTLPGLYLSSLAIIHPSAWLLDVSMEEACQIFWLRSTNVIFGLGNIILIHLLIKKIHQDDKNFSTGKRIMAAMSLGMFPLLYFFVHFYYTDTGSTFFVLLTYLLSLHGMHLPASLAGAVAVLFRQTNIVWVVFLAATTAGEIVKEFIRPEKKEIAPERVNDFEFVYIAIKQVLNRMKTNPKSIGSLFAQLMKQLWPYETVVFSFLAFVYINGGIVVGAKDDHQVSLHFPQMFYFLSFTTVLSWAHLITPVKILKFLSFLFEKPLRALIFSLVSFVLIFQFTVAHRYLLADNRHYTFYVWSKIYQTHDLVKFALIPCYLYASWVFVKTLSHRDGLWKSAFLVCIFVNLIPQMLLEFRYFTVPFLIYRLNIERSTYLQYVLEISFYVAVNVCTYYIYFEKTFKWEGNDAVQRFMW